MSFEWEKYRSGFRCEKQWGVFFCFFFRGGGGEFKKKTMSFELEKYRFDFRCKIIIIIINKKFNEKYKSNFISESNEFLMR